MKPLQEMFIRTSKDWRTGIRHADLCHACWEEMLSFAFSVVHSLNVPELCKRHESNIKHNMKASFSLRALETKQWSLLLRNIVFNVPLFLFIIALSCTPFRYQQGKTYHRSLRLHSCAKYSSLASEAKDFSCSKCNGFCFVKELEC